MADLPVLPFRRALTIFWGFWPKGNTVIDLMVVVGLEVVLNPCSQGPGSVYRRYWSLMD